MSFFVISFERDIILQGLNFRAGWWESRPKFRNPVENNHEGGRLRPRNIFGFLEIFAFIKQCIITVYLRKMIVDLKVAEKGHIQAISRKK